MESYLKLFNWELKGKLETNIAWCNKHQMQYQIKEGVVYVNSEEFYTNSMNNTEHLQN